jgi:putative hydrolase of the HAD superfamily
MVKSIHTNRAIVLFDAVGTVIKPVPGVIDVYHRLGAKHGSILDRHAIAQRIGAARRKHFQVGTIAFPSEVHSGTPPVDPPGLISSDELELELWRRLIFDVFAELAPCEPLFQDLWGHFAQPDHWQLYDDVLPCWQRLSGQGFEIGLASNFDSRLLRIATHLLPHAGFVFYSGQIGHRKPSPMFYRKIETALSSSESPTKPKILMVGDDYENDCAAPRLAGWSAVWLNRRHDWRPVSKYEPAQEGLASLDELCDWALDQLSGFD